MNAFFRLCLIVLACQTIPSAIASPPKNTTGQWAEWFASQVTPDGVGLSCCNTADGHILDDDDVRIVDGDYHVRTEDGTWLRFPNRGQGHRGNTVLGAVSNPTGHAVAWYLGKHAYCFAEGTST